MSFSSFSQFLLPLPAVIRTGLLALFCLTQINPAAAQNTAGQAGQPAADADEIGALHQRIRKLEAQLIDMQSMIGTLQTLLRPGGGAGPQAVSAPRFSAGSAPDVGVVDTQIRALSAQMSQLSRRISSLEGGPGTAVPQQQQPSFDNQRGNLQQLPPGSDQDFWGRNGGKIEPNSAPSTGFGTMTVTPEKRVMAPVPVPIPPIKRTSVDQMNSGSLPQPATRRQTRKVSPTTPRPTTAEARASYQEAYRHMLRRDFRAAESAFNGFLQDYPNDQLAGNAQYWLGETFLVRGQYKKAADIFLVGYQKYNRNIKAPDTLMKLAVSLQRLGKKDAACATFSELDQKFPNAPRHIRDRAKSEKRRAGC